MKKGLGKGLAALIAEIDDESEVLSTQDVRLDDSNKGNGNGLQNIDINLIIQNPNQPRKNFDEEALNELASSILMHGIIQPIVVTPYENKFMIIAGERRYRASILAKLNTMPAIVRNYTPRQKK